MSVMPALKLDYQRGMRNVPQRGTVLLVAALVAGTATSAYYARLSMQVDDWAAKVEQLERASIARPSTGRDGERAAADLVTEVRRANDAVGKITLPWEPLFQAVDSVASNDVTLLALEPNPEKGTVKIGGEARNMASLLAYLRQLQECNVFGSIALQSHQVQQQDPQKPVRFVLLADWQGKP